MEDDIFRFQHKAERVNWKSDYKVPKPIASGTPLHKAPLSGRQVLKRLSLWETFLIQATAFSTQEALGMISIAAQSLYGDSPS